MICRLNGVTMKIFVTVHLLTGCWSKFVVCSRRELCHKWGYWMRIVRWAEAWAETRAGRSRWLSVILSFISGGDWRKWSIWAPFDWPFRHIYIFNAKDTLHLVFINLLFLYWTCISSFILNANIFMIAFLFGFKLQFKFQKQADYR